MDPVTISIIAVSIAMVIAAVIIFIYWQEESTAVVEETPPPPPVYVAPTPTPPTPPYVPPPPPPPPPPVCPKMTVTSINPLWTNSDWPNYQKIMTNQCALDATSKSKYGSLYDKISTATYEILNPECKAADNIIMPAGKVASTCNTTYREPIFRTSVPDPMNPGTCVLNPTSLYWNMPTYNVWDASQSWICVPHKNKTDCGILSGTVGPDGTTPQGLCMWAPTYVAGKFTQKPAYFYPATNTRDQFGPYQYDGRGLYGDGYVLAADAGTFAVHETCEYVLDTALPYLGSAGASPNVYIWSRVIPDYTNVGNKYKTVITEINLSSATLSLTTWIAWAPSKTITYINGVAARRYVPVCKGISPCVDDSIADPKLVDYACSSCYGSNLEARKVICPVSGGYAQC